MSDIASRIQMIRDNEMKGSQVRVLIVEGSDDVTAFQNFAAKRNAHWDRTWAITAAGNKKDALKMAAQLPEGWIILVDRDEWIQTQIAEYQAKLPNLVTLPRFCLESYLVDPGEIWHCLPDKMQNRLKQATSPIDETEFFKLLTGKLTEWRDHAALWQVINPLWAGLRALGFQNRLLRTDTFPNQTELHNTIKEWAQFIDDKRILDEIKKAKTTMAAMPITEFMQQNLYAKNYFPQVIVPTLNTLLPQNSEKNWRTKLFKQLPLPADLTPLWQRMGL